MQSGREDILEDFPGNIVRISDYAFSENESLAKVVLPENLEEIGSYAFSGCSSLTDLQVKSGNTFFTVEEGMLLNAERTHLLWGSPSVSGALVLPEGIVRADPRSLADCADLTKITIPDSLAFQGDTVFGDCPRLTEVILSEKNPYLKMEDGLLYGQDQLDLLLCNRNQTGTIHVADGTRAVQSNAFSGCTQVSEIILPDSVSFIFNDAFKDCSQLHRIHLPASLSMIGNDVFAGCSALTEIYYAGTQERWERMTFRFDLGLDQERTTIFFEGMPG